MTREASEREVAALTWDEIKDRLARGAAAILPIGAGAKQHGLHMPMSTDQVFAAYFSKALAERIDALIWPTLTYGFYPAFVAYAGSVSLSGATFQAAVTEIADALIGFGARRVLILDTGLSTIAPVDAAIIAAREPSRIRHLKIFAGPRFEATVRALQAAALRQPCRRDGNLADAGDRAGAGRHDAGQADALLAERPLARRAVAGRSFGPQLRAERQLRRPHARFGCQRVAGACRDHRRYDRSRG